MLPNQHKSGEALSMVPMQFYDLFTKFGESKPALATHFGLLSQEEQEFVKHATSQFMTYASIQAAFPATKHGDKLRQLDCAWRSLAIANMFEKKN